MRLLTDEQHALLVYAAESNAEYTEAEYLERREFWGENLTYRWKNYEEEAKKAKEALATLTAAPSLKVVGSVCHGPDGIETQFTTTLGHNWELLYAIKKETP